VRTWSTGFPDRLADPRFYKKSDNGTRFLGADSSRRERHPEAPTHPRTEEGQLGESVAAEKGLSGGPETIVSIRHRLTPNQRHARRPL
jgi:hypothetical protein